MTPLQHVQKRAANQDAGCAFPRQPNFNRHLSPSSLVQSPRLYPVAPEPRYTNVSSPRPRPVLYHPLGTFTAVALPVVGRYRHYHTLFYNDATRHWSILDAQHIVYSWKTQITSRSYFGRAHAQSLSVRPLNHPPEKLGKWQRDGTDRCGSVVHCMRAQEVALWQ
ncbi:uncharacterized protein BKA78DRAFT_21285 [Phyllosticta capitalensis]|uniref:uncharacterized protein n=1 Tax=Phyllosticta capitalensis TaxID=121624 RepID=UPI00313010C1